MSTQGSHCEPPANYIIEPLTFTASKMALRGKAIVSQSRFPYLASVGTFSSGNCVYGNGTFNKKKSKVKKPKSKRQCVINREALVADMKAIGKFCLCSVTPL